MHFQALNLCRHNAGRVRPAAARCYAAQSAVSSSVAPKALPPLCKRPAQHEDSLGNLLAWQQAVEQRISDIGESFASSDGGPSEAELRVSHFHHRNPSARASMLCRCSGNARTRVALLSGARSCSTKGRLQQAVLWRAASLAYACASNCMPHTLLRYLQTEVKWVLEDVVSVSPISLPFRTSAAIRAGKTLPYLRQ